MPDYRFIIEDRTGTLSGSAIKTSPESTVAAAVTTGKEITIPTGQTSEADSFISGAGGRLGKAAAQQILSPLNTATGGLATPAYNVGKSIATGASAATIGAGVAGLAVAAIMFIINKMQDRMAKMEAEATEANNRDNLLIRAGMVTQATSYKGTLSGVKKRN